MVFVVHGCGGRTHRGPDDVPCSRWCTLYGVADQLEREGYPERAESLRRRLDSNATWYAGVLAQEAALTPRE